MKRKLNGDELMMATKSLANIKHEQQWIEYQLEYYKLMLEKGLEMNHQKNLREFRQHENEYGQSLEVVKKKLSILQDQIRNGVDIKEDVTETEKEVKE